MKALTVAIKIVAADQPQTDTVTIDGTDVSFTSSAAPTKAEIASGLAAAINLDAAAKLLAKASIQSGRDLVIEPVDYTVDYTLEVSANLSIMSLVTETGEGLVNAESYVSLADADQYHLDYGNTEWSDEAKEVKEAALRYASHFLDENYRWIGLLQQRPQALGWPRILGLAFVDTFDEEGRLLDKVPFKVRRATCELALVHIKTTPLNLTVKPGSVVSQVVAGSVQVTRDMDRYDTDLGFIDDILWGLFVAGGSGQGGIVEIQRA